MPRSRKGSLLRVWGPVALFAALCVGGAAAYVLLEPKRYEARATVLVTPASAADPRFAGLPVLRDTPRSSAVQTAAQLVTTSDLAESVRQRLGLQESAADVLAHVRARPAGKSSLVAITATDSDPDTAAKLANSFAELLVAQRTATLNSAIIDATSRAFQALLALPAAAKAGPRGTALRARLAELRSLARSSDPSVQVVGHAAPPTSPARPAHLRLVLAALGGALLLVLLAGLLATFGRRREAADAANYDLAVSESLVAQLEERINGRIEALLAEQERLTAREAELSAREQELAATPVVTVTPELLDREGTLEERLKALTVRERELVRRAGELAARERAIAAREDELGTRDEELEARAEELAKRAEELEERSAAAVTPEPESEAEPEFVLAEAPPIAIGLSAPPVGQPADPLQPGRWNLNELSRIVEDHVGEFPDRRDEWLSYLFFLRSYAEPDGTLPASFDWLVEETFADLLSRS